MQRDELPAVVTVGGYEFTHQTARLWTELDSGAVVRLVNKRSGRHQGWLVPDRPGGCEPERIGVNTLLKGMGPVLDAVRDGTVFEVFDGNARQVKGYLCWTGPEVLAQLQAVIPYRVRSRTGRLIERRMFPLATEAERPAPRRAVLA